MKGQENAGKKLSEIENDLCFPSRLSPGHMKLMVSGRLNRSQDGVISFIENLPKGYSLNKIITQIEYFEPPEEKPTGFKEINEFIEPVHQQLFEPVGPHGDFTGLFFSNPFRISDDMKKPFRCVLKQKRKGLPINLDPHIGRVIDELKFSPVVVQNPGSLESILRIAELWKRRQTGALKS